MECLRDYIGIKNCSFAPSESGLYINTLPGIEFQGIDQIANSDQQNYVGVWQDVQDRSIERFRQDVIGSISGFDRKYRLRQLAQTVDLGKTLGDTITPSAAQRRGHTIELNEKGAQCVCSNMQTIYIQAVQIYLSAAGPLNVFITDIDLYEDIQIINTTGVQGWNIINIEKEFEYNRLAVTYNCLDYDSSMLDLTNFALGDNFSGKSQICSDCGWSGNFAWFDWGCGCTAIVQGYQIDNIYAPGTEIVGNNAFGVSTLYSVKCTYNNVVCKNKMFFAPAFRWLLGSELMSERIYSSRINKWTTIDLKKAMELQKKFEVEYRGGLNNDSHIEGALTTCINGIELNLTDCCLVTDAPIRMAETSF